MHTAKQVIEHALENGLIEGYSTSYSEPGYSFNDGETRKAILFANWNAKSHYDETTRKFVEDDNTMPRLAGIAEKAGYTVEWSDEWTTCDECYGAVRTQADSYSWKRSYWQTECGDIVCANCLDPVEYLETLEGCPTICNTFDHVNPADHGYTLIREQLEYGWHPGQNDSPAIVAKSLRDRGIERFLFSLDSVGQFDASFSVYVHDSEAELLIGADVESKLPYSPGEEMARVLRGEKSAHYVLETRTLTPEEFVRGDWAKR